MRFPEIEGRLTGEKRARKIDNTRRGATYATEHSPICSREKASSSRRLSIKDRRTESQPVHIERDI